jgi:hypothetical protein
MRSPLIPNQPLTPNQVIDQGLFLAIVDRLLAALIAVGLVLPVAAQAPVPLHPWELPDRFDRTSVATVLRCLLQMGLPRESVLIQYLRSV